ncbi:hybrid sensor histidine kinase/response regulator [Leptothrix discophora]|uniref:histidine kinase n=1 Tax=Leptothrix discophora TaxID=89 RepID=A0ABT9G5B9_LEPDI|nr:Hpt domain-containing protein [Leptothrix discophora]MDP4301686.1 Hpt domain-containing protein [Leptothrix discophora]
MDPQRPAAPAPVPADDLSALAWVLEELRKSLEQAHKGLRRYLREAEASASADLEDVEPAVLRNARQQLHGAVGALQLVNEAEGAQLLRASEAAVQRFVQRPQRADAKGVEAIERASFALLDYLGRRLAGKPAPAVGLFPQLRALLELNGAERIHPADLWPHDWRWRPITPVGSVGHPVDATMLADVERRMLGLVKANSVEAAAGLSRAFDSAAIGARAANHRAEATLWSIAAGFFEAWGHGLIDPDLFVKRTGSRAMAALRAKVKSAEVDASERLAQDLLFFCARALPVDPARSPYLQAVWTGYQLRHEAAGHYAEARYGRHDPALIVQARKRIASAKEVWNGVAGSEPQRLVNLGEAFSLVGDSMRRLYPDGDVLAGALSLAAEQATRTGRPPAPQLAMEVATSLLYLEAALDDGELDQPDQGDRARDMARRITAVAQGQPAQPLEPWMEELYRRVSDRQTLGSVVTELRNTLSEVERQVDQFFRSPGESGLLAAVPEQLNGMRGVFSVLTIAPAMQAVARMRADVEQLLHGEAADPRSPATLSAFHRLAGNLGALGFLIDMLSVQPQMTRQLFRFDMVNGVLAPVMGRSTMAPDVIDRAQAIAEAVRRHEMPLAQVSDQIAELSRDAQVSDQPELAASLESAREALEQAREAGAGHDTEDAAREHVAQAMDDFVATATAPMGLDPIGLPLISRPMSLGPEDRAEFAPTGLEDDDEMRGVFLEESTEVLAEAMAALESLNHAPSDLSALTTVRRAFHTLKGSSRMVGLGAFGDAAWASEQLYNHVLAEQTPASADLRTYTSDALTYFAAWVAAISRHESSAFVPEPVIASADALRLAGELMRVHLPGAAEPNAPALGELGAVSDLVDLEVPIDEAPAPVVETLQATQPVPRPSLDDLPAEPIALPEIDLVLDFDGAGFTVAPDHAQPPGPTLEPFAEAPALAPAPDWATFAPTAPLVTALTPSTSTWEPTGLVTGQEEPIDLPPEVAPDVPLDLPLDLPLDAAAPVEAEAVAADAFDSASLELEPDVGPVVEMSDLAPLDDLTVEPIDAAAHDATPALELPEAAATPLELPLDDLALAELGLAELPMAGEAMADEAMADVPVADVLVDEPAAEAVRDGDAGDAGETRWEAAGAAIEDEDPASLMVPLAEATMLSAVPEVPVLTEVFELTTGWDAGLVDLTPAPELPTPEQPAPVEPVAELDGTLTQPWERPQDAPVAVDLPLDLSLDSTLGSTPDMAPLDLPAEPVDEVDAQDLAALAALDGVDLASVTAEQDETASEPVADVPDADVPAAVSPAGAEVIRLADFRPSSSLPLAGVALSPAVPAEPPIDLMALLGRDDDVKVVGPLRLQIPLFNIYLNEADELSRRLGTELTLWSLELDRPVGATAVALAHSLAGSSATVGFTDLSQLARDLEHALDRVQFLGAGEVDDAALFVAVSDEIRRLLHQFAAGFLHSPPPELSQRLHAWMETAAARQPVRSPESRLGDSTLDSRGIGGDSDLAGLTLPTGWLIEPEPLQPADAAPAAVLDDAPDATGAPQDVPLLAEVVATGEPPVDLDLDLDGLPAPGPALDPEATLLLGGPALRDAFDGLPPAGMALPEAGSAPMSLADLPSMQGLSLDLEPVAQDRAEAFVDLPPDGQPQVLAPTPADPAADPIQPDIDLGIDFGAPTVLDASLAGPRERLAEDAPFFEPVTEPVVAPAGGVLAGALSGGLAGVQAGVQADVAAIAPQALPTPPDDVAALIEALGEDIDQSDHVDPELFPIFDEEAQELLPQLAGQVGEWRRAPTDPSAATACMRTLHTFKGSARLAGAMRLGELAHRFESAVEKLSGVSVSAADLDELQRRVDVLAAVFDSVRRSHGVAPATSMGLLQNSTAWNTRSAGLGSAPGELRSGYGTGQMGLGDAGSTLGVTGFGATGFGSTGFGATGYRTTGYGALDGSIVAPPPGVPMSSDELALTLSPEGIDWQRFVAAGEPAPVLPAERTPVSAQPVRVRAPLLDRLVNLAGEVSITRARLESEVGSMRGSLVDLNENLDRLGQQLRDLTLQADTQLESRMQAARAASQEFDPLELDRYTRLQELTRMMAESVNDVATVRSAMQRTLQSTEDELAVQARLTRELQGDLLRTRMVEFESLSERLYRVVRMAAKETGKQVRFDIVGGSTEVDRGVLDRMTAAFEHLLRNCVSHGIEAADVREAAGKDPTGSIVIELQQDGNEVSIEIRDDGAGLDLDRIRERAIAMGVIDAQAELAEKDLANLIFVPGLSTMSVVTELSGRGVGMDVVRSDVHAMGGRIETRSTRGRGTRLRLVLPLTTVVTQVVILRAGASQIAVPSNLVELVQRATPLTLEAAYQQGVYSYGGLQLPFFWLGALLDASGRGIETGRTLPVVIVRSAQQRVALHVDEVQGSHEVVVKNLGPQLSRMPGLAGMTLLPAGGVALIYNPVALAAVYGGHAQRLMQLAIAEPSTSQLANQIASELPVDRPAPLVLVVDDSLTVRRVTKRLLEREGYRVALAKDGLEALDTLTGERPVAVLSDIEMPRMDGFDLLRNIRGDAELASLPVIMITSRIAKKHRDLAAELGANHYLGKPYSEEELLGVLRQHAGAQRRVVA